MTDKKTIQEALAEVQRNAELKKVQEAKAVWGDALEIEEGWGSKPKAPKFKGKPIDPMPHGGENLSGKPKATTKPKDMELKPDRSTGKSELTPAKPTNWRDVAGLAAIGALGAAAVKGASDAAKEQPKAAATPSETKPVTSTTEKPAAPKQTFGQAFSAARKAAGGAGGKFTYGGKEYQTNIKGEKYSPESKLRSMNVKGPEAPSTTTTPTPKAETPAPEVKTPELKQKSDQWTPGMEPIAGGSATRDTSKEPVGGTPKASGFTQDKTFGPPTDKFTKPETESGGKRRKMSEENINELSAFERRFSSEMKRQGEGKTFKWHGKDILLKYADKPHAAEPKKDVPLPPRRPEFKAGSDVRDGRPMSGISPSPDHGGISPAPSTPSTSSFKAPETNSTLKNLPLDTSKPLGSTISKGPMDTSAPSTSKQTNLEYESGGKKKKMSEDTNPLIAAFLKLQDENPANMFEAAKKAKKDYDKDGKIESPKDEVWGSRFRAAKMAGKMEEGALDPKDSDATPASKTVTKTKPAEDPSTPKSYPGAASSLTPDNPTTKRMSNAVKEEEEVTFSAAELEHLNRFFNEASVAPNRPEVARGADSTSDKMSQNDVTGTSTEGGKKKVKEEVEIQEGRPKKNPTPETTERDPRKHIQVEAGRAAAGSVVDFHHNDGSKSKLTPAMGRRIVAHLQGLKPADRQAAVNKMHDSAEGLKV